MSTCPSSISDWTYMTSPKFVGLFNQILPTRSNDDLTKHFPILTWCRDNQLRLVDMDTSFRQTWHDYQRTKSRNSLSEQSTSTILSRSSSLSNKFSRRQRQNSNRFVLDIIEDELADSTGSDLEDSQLVEISSPQFIPSLTSSDTGDENDLSMSYVFQTNNQTNKNILFFFV